MRRRKGKGCPVTGALQLIGDKWTILIIRDLVNGSKRTTELLADLHPISSRTLLMRLREMESDQFIERTDYGGNPPRVEYTLTERGRLFLPFLSELKKLGEHLGCGECEERNSTAGDYCEACPNRSLAVQKQTTQPRHELDESVFLL
jgi:DNA-binding HxlR family transcriptional regulator